MSFHQKAARYSWILPLICIGLMTFCNSSLPKSSSYSWLVLGGISFLLLLSGFISGIIGCFGIKKDGWETTLMPSLIGIALNVSIFTVVTLVAVNSFFEYRENAKNQKIASIQHVLEQTNSQLPKMIDGQTRLDKVIATDTFSLKYNFTFIDYTKNEMDNIEEFVAGIKVNLDNTYNTSEEFKLFRDNNISLQYNYFDKNGELVASIHTGK